LVWCKCASVLRTRAPFLNELAGRVAAAPHFFSRTAVCLDLSALEKTPEVAEIHAVIEAVRRVGMLWSDWLGDVVELETVASALNLPILSSFRTPTRSAPVLEHEQAAPTTPEARVGAGRFERFDPDSQPARALGPAYLCAQSRSYRQCRRPPPVRRYGGRLPPYLWSAAWPRNGRCARRSRSANVLSGV